MNEPQRQAYLSALGVETYMPRWQLPFAPTAVACVLPVVAAENEISNASSRWSSVVASNVETKLPTAPFNTASEFYDFDVRQKPAGPINAAAILQELENNKPSIATPFSLSIWRPFAGHLIIDSRDTKLALPTDLLLHNILIHVKNVGKPNINEEILRWPMIENRFVSRTEVDARNELQTWLAVENELRPIEQLWLMGQSAIKYFIPEDLEIERYYWQRLAISGLASSNQPRVLLLPALTKILQEPLSKARLWAAIN